jgi:hypothetical protein
LTPAGATKYMRLVIADDDYTGAALDHVAKVGPEEGTPPVPYWLYDPHLRAAEAHARTQRLAKQAAEKKAERNAAMREYREQQEGVRAYECAARGEAGD